MSGMPSIPAADQALEAAMVDYLAAYAAEGLLIAWTIVTSQHIAEDDGTSSHAVGYWTPDAQPIYRTVGLLDYALTRLRARVAGNADATGRG